VHLVRAERPQRLPVVLTVDEVRRVIDAVEEPSRLIVKLLYGSGLRLLEALTLRVKDVDFARRQVTVRDPKSKHDRVTMLPASVSAELSEQLVRAAALHQEDLAASFRARLAVGCDRSEGSLCVLRLALAVGLSRSHALEKRDYRGPASRP
jgi:integrase